MMTTDPTIMKAVEALDYRVTAGDVASRAGIEIRYAEQGVLALASEVGGALQVSETGEIAYVFPRNFRDILRSKYFRLRLQEWWGKIWGVLFYLIRISFGLILILSIALIVLAIAIILIALASSRGDNDSDSNSGGFNGGGGFVPMYWIGPDWYWIFLPDYGDRPSRRNNRGRKSDRQMNFLEAIYSFLFGDGNPNADLEERRWQAIATVIRNNRGAVVAEQIVPYLEEVGTGYHQEYEEYMIPVLSRFNGSPHVSPEGQIVYHFPELQVTAEDRKATPVAAYLKETPWRFSRATTEQLVGAASLGVFNFCGAIFLGLLLRRSDVMEIVQQMGGLTAFVAAIYGILLAYGSGFLGIPLIRYFVVQARNRGVEKRNDRRMLRAEALNAADDTVHQKLVFAQQYAATTVVRADDLAYTTERDLTEQELERKDQIDAEWQRRLEQSESP